MADFNNPVGLDSTGLASANRSLRRRQHLLTALAIWSSAAGLASNAVAASPASPATRATVVLVHGAMADSSSWAAVVPALLAHGHPVIAVANPLRSLRGDSDYLSSLLKTVSGPIVLVGHSYGGEVITNAANGNSNVKALVYVAAFAPAAGESAFDMVGRFPGSMLGEALAQPVPLPDGANDLHIEPSKFAGPFAADQPADQVAVMAVTQRPVTDVALKEASGAPAWAGIPSWFVYGSADKSIPPQAQAFMAKRAGARQVIVIPGASHVVMVSHATEVAHVIEAAVNAVNP